MVETSLKNPQERFQEFFKIKKYRNLIKQMALTDRSSITMDFFDLLDFDPMLAKALLEKPEKFLSEYAVEALRSQLKIEDKEYAEIVEKLMKEYGISSLQADTIAEMKTYQFSKEYFKKYLKEKEEIDEKVV
ncbi:MAG: hypothetical protein N3E48_04820, partial [Candidatus Bathyarchaeota archaeon]|nr:hypothetical protein [Candidatus Bathyarchaeota archaeon]